jgi:hypothetical protein
MQWTGQQRNRCKPCHDCLSFTTTAPVGAKRQVEREAASFAAS